MRRRRRNSAPSARRRSKTVLPIQRAIPLRLTARAKAREAGEREAEDLDVEAEVDHVAVAHRVVLAFQTKFACLLGAELALEGDEVVVGGDLGADEAALEIGMDDTGCLRRRGACTHRPGTHFLRPAGEKGLQSQ